MEQKGNPESANPYSITTKIVKEISSREGVDPLELSPSLYSVIDIEAVEDLFVPAENATSSERISLTFDYQGYEVTIENDDGVTVSVKKTD